MIIIPDVYWPIPCGIILGAILLDITLGDPPNRYHPTAWVGKIIAVMVPYRRQRYWGVIVVIASCCVVATAAIILVYIAELLIPFLYIIISILILKSTISIRGMERHAILVYNQVTTNDAQAKAALACIVKRDTANLSASQICSGTIESVAENTTDGTTAPLFYMGLFGVVGALISRTINTIDSMAGYRSYIFEKVGWFGAHCDTILGWAPARITAYVMVLSALILRYDYRGAYSTIRTHHNKPDSLNSGYTISAMAGALNITLEKPGKYSVGSGREANVKDIRDSIRIMKCTSYIFGGIACGITYVMAQVWQWVL